MAYIWLKLKIMLSIQDILQWPWKFHGLLVHAGKAVDKRPPTAASNQLILL